MEVRLERSNVSFWQMEAKLLSSPQWDGTPLTEETFVELLESALPVPVQNPRLRCRLYQEARAYVTNMDGVQTIPVLRLARILSAY